MKPSRLLFSILGEFVAVALYFWRDWWQLIIKGFTSVWSVEGRRFFPDRKPPVDLLELLEKKVPNDYFSNEEEEK